MKTKLLAVLLLLASPLLAADFPDWMAGSWQGADGPVRMEETWTPSDGRMMLGLHRDTGPEKTTFEFLRIETRGDTLVYLAQPGGRPPVAFPMKTTAADRIVFENLQHDFPKRIIYWRDGERLCARVEGPMNGKDVEEEWCWTRMEAVK